MANMVDRNKLNKDFEGHFLEKNNLRTGKKFNARIARTWH